MYSATNNYENKMRADKAKAKLNEMNSARKPKTRTNLLGRKVEITYGQPDGAFKTKKVTKKDGSYTLKSKSYGRVKNEGGYQPIMEKTKTKVGSSKFGNVMSSKSKVKQIGGLKRLVGGKTKSKMTKITKTKES